MRWKWIIPRLVIVVSLWAFLKWGMDPALRYAAVRAVQSVTGARVDVAAVRTRFFPPTVDVSQVAVASARRQGRNLFEFDQMHLQLESRSLSQRRLVVEDGRIENLRFDTVRKDDGQLEQSTAPTSSEPSWLTEKVTELGDQWLTQLSKQVRDQLDPNLLESYRVGSGIYSRWDTRFAELEDRAKAMESKVRTLEDQFKAAKQGDTLEQIEKYLQLAQEADLLLRDARQFQNDLKSITPEVRADFEALNAARLHDQEMIRHKITLLKPDGPRITQALLGKAMYLRIQQTLSWIETIRDWQSDLAEQVRPPRSAGREFPVVLMQPAPDVLLKNLRLSGSISIDEEFIPYSATVRNVTEDPKLLGQPSLFQLTAAGRKPLRLNMTVDATGQQLSTELDAELQDQDGFQLTTGRREDALFQAGLKNLAWSMKLKLDGDQLQGFVNLRSDLQGLSFEASDDVRPEILEATNQALGAVRTLDALVALNGSLQKPDVVLTSDIGEQIADGVQAAFYHQLEKARDRLLAEVNEHASEQLQSLKLRFADEYQRLAEDNQKLLGQIQDVQSILVSLRSGQANPVTIARQVSQSRLLSEKDQQKVQRVLNEVDGAMQGQLPQAILKKLPPSIQQLPNTPIMAIPGLLPGNLGGLFPGLMAGTIPGTPTGPFPGTPPLRSSENKPEPDAPDFTETTPAPVGPILPVSLPGLLPSLFPGLMQPATPPAAQAPVTQTPPSQETTSTPQRRQAPLIIPRFRLGTR